jgi:hypothetical protein
MTGLGGGARCVRSTTPAEAGVWWAALHKHNSCGQE